MGYMRKQKETNEAVITINATRADKRKREKQSHGQTQRIVLVLLAPL